MIKSSKKAAVKKRHQRTKRIAKLTQSQAEALKRRENDKQRQRRQRAKVKKTCRQVLNKKIERQVLEALSQVQWTVVEALTVKGNKKGLRDEALKKAVDEYRERLIGNGKTRAEAHDEQLEEIDDKLMAKLADVRKKLKSAEMSRLRYVQLYATAKAEVGVAHGRRHAMERDRNQLLKALRQERALYLDAVRKNKNLQDLNWELLRHKPTQKEQEIWQCNKSLCGEL